MSKKEKKKKKRIGLKIFIVILLILLAIGAYFIVRTNQLGGGKQGMLAALLGHNENTLKNLDPLYVLVLGESVSSDSRLTDTILVCKYDPKTQTGAMMSIPRDTFTGTNRASASAYYKINNAYQMGQKPENALKAVNKITGLDIKYYVIVNTEVLKKLVDAVGGVYFDVPIDMHYIDVTQDLFIDLKAGYQLLDGNKAEQVVRFRHNNSTKRNVTTTYPSDYGVEDYGRMRTQRAFIKALMEKLLKPENILKVGEFMDIFYENVKTNIELDFIKDYIPYAVNFSTDSLKTEQLPGEDKFVEATGTWMFFHYESATKKLVNELFLSVPAEEAEDSSNTTKNETN